MIENSINPLSAIATTTTQSATLTNGSVNVTGLTSTQYLYGGQPVSGTGVPAGATIAAITGATSVKLSAAFTGTTGSVALTFTAAKGLFLGSAGERLLQVAEAQNQAGLALCLIRSGMSGVEALRHFKELRRPIACCVTRFSRARAGAMQFD